MAKAKIEAKDQSKNQGMSNTQKIGIGVGLTAAVAAAAGTYFLYGSKSAAKNRKAVKSWALKAKAEVLETLEKAQEMSQDEYEKLIDTVTGVYGELKEASKMDVSVFKKEMKDHWKNIVKTASPKKKAVAKKMKAVAPLATKVVKKMTAKATKKA